MSFQPVKCNIMQSTRTWIKKINASYSLEATVLDNIEKIKYHGVTITNDLKWNTHVSSIKFAQMPTGPFASLDVPWRNVHETLKSRLTRDWYVLSLTMGAQFRTPKVFFS